MRFFLQALTYILLPIPLRVATWRTSSRIHVMRWSRTALEAGRRERLPDIARMAPRTIRQCYRNLADTIVGSVLGLPAPSSEEPRDVRRPEPSSARSTGARPSPARGPPRQLGVAADGGRRALPDPHRRRLPAAAPRRASTSSCATRAAGWRQAHPARAVRLRALSHVASRAYALIADQTPRAKIPSTDALPAPGHRLLGAGKIARVPRVAGLFRVDEGERRGHYVVRSIVIARAAVRPASTTRDRGGYAPLPERRSSKARPTGCGSRKSGNTRSRRATRRRTRAVLARAAPARMRGRPSAMGLARGGGWHPHGQRW